MHNTMALAGQFRQDRHADRIGAVGGVNDRAKRKENRLEKQGARQRNEGLAQAAGGAGMEATGVTMQAGGRGMRVAGKGMERGGAAMTRAGVAMSSTGLGALVGVPLALGGAAVAGAGGATDVVGTGVDAGGRAVSRVGERNVRKGLSRAAEGEGVKKAGAVMGASSDGAKVVTNRFLAFCWLAIIPSLGLSLIYINLHVFLHMLFPSVFGKLGEEWIPKQAMIGGENSGVKEASKTAGIVEAILLILLDLVLVFAIVGVIMILIMLLDWVFFIFGIFQQIFTTYDPYMMIT